jgi:hypothetical protein
MRVCLDLDDFCLSYPRIGLLLKLREHFPSFKVSLFTIPFDTKLDYGPYLLRESALREIKRHLEWMQIIPHGFYHDGSEVMDWNYTNTKAVYLPQIMKAFNDYGLPFELGFKAPHWRWNEGVALALDDEGWWGAIDRDKTMPVTKRFYRYNYLLNEPFWESKEAVLKLHGHIYGTKNDLGLCFENLLKLPKDTQWVFATELLEERS